MRLASANVNAQVHPIKSSCGGVYIGDVIYEFFLSGMHLQVKRGILRTILAHVGIHLESSVHAAHGCSSSCQGGFAGHCVWAGGVLIRAFGRYVRVHLK